MELSVTAIRMIFAVFSTASSFCDSPKILDFRFDFVCHIYVFSCCLYSVTGNSPSTGLSLRIPFCSLNDQIIKIKL